GVRRTRTAARLVVPSGAAPVVPPAPPPVERRGAVVAGRLGAAGAEGTPVVDGATVTGTVEVVDSATGDTTGVGPTARSRWWLPPLPHAAAIRARTTRAAANVRR